MNYLSVPYGLRISVEKSISIMRRNLLHRIPRSFIRLPWSIVCNKRSPRILFSVISLPRAQWSWRRHDRWHPRNKIYHRFWFCCDSFFSWFLLKSFCHCSRANSRTEMADVKQAQQMIPLITREISFGQQCQRVGFWCRCILFGFWNPDWFDRTTIESKSVGSGNMSHCRTPSFNDHFWSLLHCLQTHTIKLLHAQIGHLMERNQCLPLHWSSFEIYDACEHHCQVAPIYLKHEKHFQEQKQVNPIIPEQANHLISVQCPKR